MSKDFNAKMYVETVRESLKLGSEFELEADEYIASAPIITVWRPVSNTYVGNIYPSINSDETLESATNRRPAHNILRAIMPKIQTKNMLNAVPLCFHFADVAAMRMVFPDTESIEAAGIVLQFCIPVCAGDEEGGIPGFPIADVTTMFAAMGAKRYGAINAIPGCVGSYQRFKGQRINAVHVSTEETKMDDFFSSAFQPNRDIAGRVSGALCSPADINLFLCDLANLEY